VVPGFGAFLTRSFPAEINPATHMFRPPSKRVAFNARIQENDGLLAKYVAKLDGVSYEKAIESITISVRGWKQALRAGRKVNLAGIGKLYMSDTGKLQFNPAHDTNYDVNSYGLNIFRASAMEREQEIKRSVNKAIEKHQTKKAKTISLPIEAQEKIKSSNYRRWVAVLGPVAALLVVGAYLFQNPSTYNRVQSQVSAIFSTDSLSESGVESMAGLGGSSESTFGFPEGPRLNGDFGPEDDVVKENTTSSPAEIEKIEVEEPAAVASVTSELKPKSANNIPEKTIPAEPATVPVVETKEAVVTTTDADIALVAAKEETAEEPTKETAKGTTEKSAKPRRHNLSDLDKYTSLGKPLYNIKERSESEENENDDSYSDDPKPLYKVPTNEKTNRSTQESTVSKAQVAATKVKKAETVASKNTELKPSATSSATNRDVADLKGSFQIIVGAFSSEANAARYANQLKSQGWSAYTYASGSMYRVAIGKLTNRNSANQLLVKVKKELNYRAWVNLGQ
jgi:nucleoid DNA-binding protein